MQLHAQSGQAGASEGPASLLLGGRCRSTGRQVPRCRAAAIAGLLLWQVSTSCSLGGVVGGCGGSGHEQCGSTRTLFSQGGGRCMAQDAWELHVHLLRQAACCENAIHVAQVNLPNVIC